jgi:hypothetical protein
MKAIKTLLAVAVVAGAASAQAATYNVTGAQTGAVITAVAPTTATNTPAVPSFAGVWDVTGSSLSGNVDFEAYSTAVAVDLGGFFLNATINNPNSLFNITGGTFASSGLTVTLTNAVGSFVGTTPTCTGNALVCSNQPAPGIADLDLTLTFADASLSSFTGVITGTNSDANGTTVYTWEFSGVEEVPLPAAAWLFGSGLIGLAGAVRRRRAAA